MANKSYQRHVYDVELKSILKKYKEEIVKVRLEFADKTPEYFVGLVKFVIEGYCKFKGINFNKKVQIVVDPKDDGAYKQFLAYSLAFYEPYKIRQYLNYHEKHYQSKSKGDYSFVNFTEFILVDMVKYASPFDNSNRLNQIMMWVEDKRESLPSAEILDPVTKFLLSPPSDHELRWQPEKSLLKKLSAKLKGTYTTRKSDFSDVFNYKKKIEWKASVHSWVYLMYRLTKDPLNYITTNMGIKHYLKIGGEFFFFSKETERTSGNINFSTILNSVIGRSKDKHKKIRDDIDIILKFSLDRSLTNEGNSNDSARTLQ